MAGERPRPDYPTGAVFLSSMHISIVPRPLSLLSAGPQHSVSMHTAFPIQSCQNRTLVRIYATIESATWAVPSKSLQGVRRVPMAKITALLLAAAVLVLSIALLYLAVF